MRENVAPDTACRRGPPARSLTTITDMFPDSQRHVEVDDRFLADWIDFGFDRMVDYLAKHARFAAFCERRDAGLEA